MIVEEILRNIREENIEPKIVTHSKKEDSGPAILSLAGIIDEQEAEILNSAVEESRKIDRDEW